MVFLAHFTGSGLSEIENLDIERYSRYLNSAIELDKEEIKRTLVVGFEKGEN